MVLVHVLAGSIALAAGAFALAAPKGSTRHRRAGRVFAIAMVVMTVSALVVAGWLHPNRINALAALLTLYLVATGWLTMARPASGARLPLAACLVLAAGTGAFAAWLAINALAGTPGAIPREWAPLPLVFGAAAWLGALGDARLLRAGAIARPRRVARHRWRIGSALWIATSSFFLGQARQFPDAVRASGVLALPVLLLTVLLAWWLWRTLRRPRPAAAAAAAAAAALRTDATAG
jgi:hypothetical protein